MELRTRLYKNVTIVLVNGRLEPLTVFEFERLLGPAIDNCTSSLIVNMSGVDFICSAGLRVILNASKKVRNRNGQMFLAELQEPVKRVFQVSGLNRLFEIFDTEREAIERSLKNNSTAWR